MCTRLGMYIILARFHVYIFSGKSQANCYKLFALEGGGGGEASCLAFLGGTISLHTGQMGDVDVG